MGKKLKKVTYDLSKPKYTKQERLERSVIGHALAFTHYLDYMAPRSKYGERHHQSLFKACDRLRKYLKETANPL